MKIAQTYWMLLIAYLCAGCGNSLPQAQPVAASTRISGFVWFDGYPSSGKVRFYKYGQSTFHKELVQDSVLEKSGAFSIDAGAFCGAGHIEIILNGGSTLLSTDIANIAQFSNTKNIMVTPITHLASGFAEYLLTKKGMSSADAISTAKERVYDYFGALDHDKVIPWTDECERGEINQHGGGPRFSCERPKGSASVQALYEPVQIRLYVDAFASLANQIRDGADKAMQSYITLSSVLKYLYSDIAADGVFDGSLSSVSIAGGAHLQLSPEELRNQLSRAFLHAVSLHAPEFAIADEAAEQVAFALQTKKSELFPQRDTMGFAGMPTISCAVITEDLKRRDLSFPHRGTISLECSWPFVNALYNPSVKFSIEKGKEEHAVENLELLESGRFVATINTRALSALSNAFTFPMTISAENQAGMKLQHSTILKVRNTAGPLEIQSSKSAGRRGEPFLVQGASENEIQSLVFTVESYESDGQKSLPYGQQKFFPFDEKTFSFSEEIPVPCAPEVKVQLTVTDWAGNKAIQDFTYYCMNYPPSLQVIPTSFRGDGEDNEVKLGVEGETPQLVKQYNKLDYIPNSGDARTVSSENLPVINILVRNALGAYGIESPFGELKVSYRYSLDEQSENSDIWIPLPDVHNDVVYAFPISYQTLLPQRLLAKGPLRASAENFIARCSPDNTHTLEFKVEDGVGNQTYKKVAFKLLTKAPRLELDQCVASGALAGASITNGSIAQVLQHGFDLYEARLSFPLRLHEESLCPRDSVSLALSGGTAEVSVSALNYSYQQVSRDTFPGRLRDQLVDRFRHFICHSRGCRIFEGDEAAQRFDAFQDLSAVSSQKTPEARQDLAWRYDLFPECFDDGGQKIISRQKATGELLPDRTYTCRFKVDAPTASSKQGAEVDWAHVVLDAQKRHGIFLKNRFGVEEGTSEGSWKRRYYQETTSVGGLKFDWQPEVPLGNPLFGTRRLHVPLGLSGQCSAPATEVQFTVDGK